MIWRAHWIVLALELAARRELGLVAVGFACGVLATIILAALVLLAAVGG